MALRRSIAVPIATVVAGLALLVVANAYNQSPSNQATSSTAENSILSKPGDPLSAAIDKAQVRLRAYPNDDQTWAQLGTAYVQQARVTGNPSYYPKAEGALQRSLSLNPTDNWPGLVGMGSLANARHEFRQALGWARKAQAVNAYNATIYAVLNDALTQLGDYARATVVLQQMLNLRPGVPAFTRASYEFEEHGQVAAAQRALVRALAEASAPADIAFCRYYLGELAFNQGNPEAALGQYQLGLTVAPDYDPLLAGRAKAEAALGQTVAARHDYATVIARVPQPQYVLENAELLQSLGRTALAERQFELLRAEDRLLAANGVVDDLTTAVVDADHGSASSAVIHARAEWRRRKSVLVADALGWALHRAGRDREALTYARLAGRLGWRNATFSYHRGMIELALGNRPEAGRLLTTALKINPHFSSSQAPIARRTLASLRAAR